MAFAGMCPYLKSTRDLDHTVCECAKFSFPDKAARRDMLYGYCGHPTDWKNCTFKAVMDKYYERVLSPDEATKAEFLERENKRFTNLKNERKRRERDT